MKFYSEKARDICVRAEVDVCVTGAGPAGFSVAITAARCGAKTILIEQAGQVGTIAAMSVEKNISPKDLDIKGIQSELTRQGVTV